MAIHFRCACGKQMTAKDDFAGRRYRCPQCEKVVRIPIPKAKKQPASPAPSAKPAVKEKPAAAIAVKSAPVAPAAAKTPTAKVVVKPAAPLAKPITAAPIGKPVAVAPLAKPMETAPPTTAVATPPRPHPWEDRSLMQAPTPWLPGDEARFQAGVKPPREGFVWWEKLALSVVVIGAGAAAIAATQYLG